MAEVLKYLFTSESVTEGHPDKVADQISDAVLDAVLEQDPYGPRGLRSPGHHRHLRRGGRNHHQLLRGRAEDRARHHPRNRLHRRRVRLRRQDLRRPQLIQGQSPDIAMGVDPGGAGDQGLMFGYACNETDELMPLPIQLAHRLCEKLSEIRKFGPLTYLRPDGKSQVSVEYVDGKPTRIDAIVVSTQHGDDVSTEQLREDVRKHIIDAVVPANMVDEHQVPHQSDRTFRHRRTPWRYRSHGPQDYRR
jgi:S-adenosylmethionine synthetase